MAQFCPDRYLTGSILASFMEKKGVKVEQKLKKVPTLGTSSFCKHLDFLKIFKTLFFFL